MLARTESGTKVLIEFPDGKERMNARLVGTDPENYVVLKVPVAPGVRNRLFGGNVVTVRFLDRGSVVGFRTRIQEFVTRPHPLLFLDYPHTFETHDLRSSQRVDCNFPAELTLGNKRYSGLMADVSVEGCRVVLDQLNCKDEERIPSGEQVFLRFHILDPDAPLALEAVVRNRTCEDDHLVAGLSFLPGDDAVKAKIEQYVGQVVTALHGG